MKRIVLTIAGLALFGYIVMLLWNALVPELFKGPYIMYLQAVGLLLLTRILLYTGGGGCCSRRGWRKARWRKRWERKLEKMTPEQREKFKTAFRSRCGWNIDDCAPSSESGDREKDQDAFYDEFQTEQRKRRWGWSPEAEEKFKQAKESFKEEWKRFMAYPGMSAEERAKFKEEWTRRVIGPTNMTPEEKEKFKDELKRKWGWSPEAEERFKAEWQRVWGWSPEAQEKFNEEWKRRTGDTTE